jgi:hypothetical protein
MENFTTDLDHVLLRDALSDADNERDLRLQRLHDGRRSAYTEPVLSSRIRIQIRSSQLRFSRYGFEKKYLRIHNKTLLITRKT